MSLNALPSELLETILSHLDIPSLLAFSLTSSTNYAHHLHALHTLHLAVFPKKVHALIAFLQHSNSTEDFHAAHHRISIPLRQRPNRHTNPKTYRNSIISSQNAHLTTLLTRYGQSLETLSFHAWDILPATASALAENSTRLRRLSLAFDHSSSRDPCIPTAFFEQPTRASSLWSALAGLGAECDGKLVLRNLLSLRLERAGCTSAQLRGMVARNPRLRSLRLRKVRGVDEEFVDWLGSDANTSRSNLAVLCIEECANLELSQAEDYFWLSKLDGLTNLKIFGCARVDEKKLRSMYEGLKIKEMGGFDQQTVESSDNGILEVDESCF
jgi:hypothetical protein